MLLAVVLRYVRQSVVKRRASGGPRRLGRGATIRRRDDLRAALAASHERVRAVLETALDCVVAVDAHGRVIEFNPAAERTFGYTAAEARGREMAELHRAARAATAGRAEHHLRGAAGAARVRRLLRDITDRRRAEAELRESRARIVVAADEARRRIERDLHDGVQQQLIALAVTLTRARDGGGVAMLDDAVSHLFAVMGSSASSRAASTPPFSPRTASRRRSPDLRVGCRSPSTSWRSPPSACRPRWRRRRTSRWRRPSRTPSRTASAAGPRCASSSAPEC